MPAVGAHNAPATVKDPNKGPGKGGGGHTPTVTAPLPSSGSSHAPTPYFPSTSSSGSPSAGSAKPPKPKSLYHPGRYKPPTTGGLKSGFSEPTAKEKNKVQAADYESSALNQLASRHYFFDNSGNVKMKDQEVPIQRKGVTDAKVARASENLDNKLAEIRAQVPKSYFQKKVKPVLESAMSRKLYKVDKKTQTLKTETVQVPKLRHGEQAYTEDLKQIERTTHQIKTGKKQPISTEVPEGTATLSAAPQETSTKASRAAAHEQQLQEEADAAVGGLQEAGILPQEMSVGNKIVNRSTTGLLAQLGRPLAASESYIAKQLVDPKIPTLLGPGIDLPGGGVIHGDTARKIKSSPGPLAAFLANPETSDVIHGGDIAQGLGLPKQLGLPIDIIADPLSWVGGAGLLTRGGLDAAKAAERIRAAVPEALDGPQFERIAAEAARTGDYEALNLHLRRVADAHNVSLSKLDPRGRIIDRNVDRAFNKDKGPLAPKYGQKAFNDRLHAEVKANLAKAQGTFKYGKNKEYQLHLPGARSEKNIAEIGRSQLSNRAVRPGVRVRLMTPVGHEFASIKIPLPKNLLTPVFKRDIARAIQASRISTKAGNVATKINAELTALKAEAKLAYDNHDVENFNRLQAQVAAKEDELLRAHPAAKAEYDTPVTLARLDERAALRNRKMAAHEQFRVSNHLGRHLDQNVQEHILHATQQIAGDPISLLRVSLYRHLRHDTGGTKLFDEIGNLTPKEMHAVRQLDTIDQELARHGIAAGTLQNELEHYATRLVQRTGTPLGHEQADPFRELNMQSLGGAGSIGKSFAQRHRQQAELASLADPNVLAEAITQAAHGSVSPTRARELAEDWFRQGKVRLPLELVTRRIQRSEAGLTPEEVAALTDTEAKAMGYARSIGDKLDEPYFSVTSEENPNLLLDEGLASRPGMEKFTNDPFEAVGSDLERRRRMLHSALVDRARVEEVMKALRPTDAIHADYRAIADRLDEEIASLNIKGKDFGPEPQAKTNLQESLEAHKTAVGKVPEAQAHVEQQTAIVESIEKDIADLEKDIAKAKPAPKPKKVDQRTAYDARVKSSRAVIKEIEARQAKHRALMAKLADARAKGVKTVKGKPIDDVIAAGHKKSEKLDGEHTVATIAHDDLLSDRAAGKKIVGPTPKSSIRSLRAQKGALTKRLKKEREILASKKRSLAAHKGRVTATDKVARRAEENLERSWRVPKEELKQWQQNNFDWGSNTPITKIAAPDYERLARRGGASHGDQPLPGQEPVYGTGRDDPYDVTALLPDVRSTQGMFYEMDPRRAMFFRGRVEASKTVYNARWRGFDQQHGISESQANGSIAYIKGGLKLPASRLKRVFANGKWTGEYMDRETKQLYAAGTVDIPDGYVPVAKDAHGNVEIWFDPVTQQEYMKPVNINSPLGQAIQEDIGGDRLWPTTALRDIQHEQQRMAGGKGGSYDAIFQNGMENFAQKAASLMRYGVTVPFPAYHIRNITTDVLKSLQADSGVIFHPYMNTRLMMMAASRGGKATIKVPGFTNPMTPAEFLFMADQFGIRSTQHLAEFAHLADGGKEPGAYRRSWFNLGPKGKLGHVMIKYGARREDIVRFQTFFQRMRRNGGDVADATWYMIKHHFDYGDLSSMERRVTRNLFLFYTWYRKNIPLQFMEMINRPGFFAAVSHAYQDSADGTAPWNINWSKLASFLPDMSGRADMRGLIPDYMLQQLGGIVTSWNGHTATFATGAPWVDMNLILNMTNDPGSTTRQWFSMLNPAIPIFTQLAFQKNTLLGSDFKLLEPASFPNDLIAKGLGLNTLEDQYGRTEIPWIANVFLRNLPLLGRGSGYFSEATGEIDSGRLQNYRNLISFLGVNSFVTPSRDRYNDAAALVLKQKLGEGQNFRMSIPSTLEPRDKERLWKHWIRTEYKPFVDDHNIPMKVRESVEGDPKYISATERAERKTGAAIGGLTPGSSSSSGSGGDLNFGLSDTASGMFNFGSGNSTGSTAGGLDVKKDTSTSKPLPPVEIPPVGRRFDPGKPPERPTQARGGDGAFDWGSVWEGTPTKAQKRFTSLYRDAAANSGLPARVPPMHLYGSESRDPRTVAGTLSLADARRMNADDGGGVYLGKELSERITGSREKWNNAAGQSDQGALVHEFAHWGQEAGMNTAEAEGMANAFRFRVAQAVGLSPASTRIAMKQSTNQYKQWTAQFANASDDEVLYGQFGEKPPTQLVGNGPSTGARKVVLKKYTKAAIKAANSGTPVIQGLDDPRKAEFAAELSKATGLSAAVTGAWTGQEGGNPNGDNNWLNIGWNGAPDEAIRHAPEWNDPVSAAKATAQWLNGQFGDQYNYMASAGIQNIIPAAKGAPDAQQIATIAGSGWAGDPNYASNIQRVYGGISVSQPKNAYKIPKALETKAENVLGEAKVKAIQKQVAQTSPTAPDTAGITGPKKIVESFKHTMKVAERIDAANVPYVYGGGHGGGVLGGVKKVGGFDCSSVTSKLLQEAGVFKNGEVLVSGDFGSAPGLSPGEGNWTIYYNGGHVFSKIGNTYYGTSSADNTGSGGVISQAVGDAQVNSGEFQAVHVDKFEALKGMGKFGMPTGSPAGAGGTPAPTSTAGGSVDTGGVPAFSSNPIAPEQPKRLSYRREDFPDGVLPGIKAAQENLLNTFDPNSAETLGYGFSQIGPSQSVTPDDTSYGYF